MSLYDNAVEEVKGAKTSNVSVVALAKVTSLTDGKANIQFNGDNAPSTKLYPYIKGIKPAVNDIVCLLSQGNTFIIIGIISKDNIVDNYNVDKAALTSLLDSYLTTETASTTYLTIATAEADYLTKVSAAETYRGKNAYFDRLGSGNNYISISGTTISANGSLDLGTSNKKFTSVTTAAIDTDAIRTPTGTSLFNITASHMDPPSNNGTSIGTSSRKLNNLYATNIYGTVADPSDRRVKKSIKDLGRKWLDFFYRLRPASFKYKDGTSDRTHTGFIAQEVEAAANDVGIDTKDIATIVIDEDGHYYLRYEELIAVQTLAIHDLKAQVDDLTVHIRNLERIVYK